VEAELVTKSGKKKTYYFTGHAFHGKEEPCLIGTGIDISERKKLEEQLRNSQKMEAMGLLAGGIAHDFNNLLTGILGYANLLSINERVDPEVARAAGIIQRSAEKASQLTAQLLGFAEQGKKPERPGGTWPGDRVRDRRSREDAGSGHPDRRNAPSREGMRPGGSVPAGPGRHEPGHQRVRRHAPWGGS